MSRPLLQVVATPTNHPERPTRLVVVAPEMAARVVSVGYRVITVPLISLLLVDYCQLGKLMDTNSHYGRQVSAELAVLYRGSKVTINGAIVPLVGMPDLLLPAGIFSV